MDADAVWHRSPSVAARGERPAGRESSLRAKEETDANECTSDRRLPARTDAVVRRRRGRPTLGRPDGTAFTSFLGTLNEATSSDGTTSSDCFAGHCDWRLPSIVELHTIVDLTAPGCGDGGACIDQTVFGPTTAFFYWSATTDTDLPVFAWGVAFGADGIVTSAIEDFVRGVRSAL
jgi:hypothetical protein